MALWSIVAARASAADASISTASAALWTIGVMAFSLQVLRRRTSASRVRNVEAEVACRRSREASRAGLGSRHGVRRGREHHAAPRAGHRYAALADARPGQRSASVAADRERDRRRGGEHLGERAERSVVA